MFDRFNSINQQCSIGQRNEKAAHRAVTIVNVHQDHHVADRQPDVVRDHLRKKSNFAIDFRKR